MIQIIYNQIQRREFKGESLWPTVITTRFKSLSRTIKNIYDGTERIPFKIRNIHFQEIFQNEFGQD
ncbi:hypothetical protein LCGC14_1054190 [marine sediment metagenome]|uniref:Uncharacterized protein n=1 Tax=marine sediment metagenome TaxID=412755 RepID=A0A0F9N9S0_9ZZZZ